MLDFTSLQLTIIPLPIITGKFRDSTTYFHLALIRATYYTVRENGFNPMTKCTNEIVRLSHNVIQ